MEAVWWPLFGAALSRRPWRRLAVVQPPMTGSFAPAGQEAGRRHFERERRDVGGGQVVLAGVLLVVVQQEGSLGGGEVSGARDVQQVEDHAEVDGERVLALADEDLAGRRCSPGC